MIARLRTSARLTTYYIVAAVGYLVGVAAGLLTTLALWFVGAVIAGYRAGRG